MNWSLRNRFLVPTLSVVFLCLAASAGVSFWKSKNALHKTISDQVVYVSSSIDNQLSSWLGERKEDVKIFSDSVFCKTVVCETPESGHSVNVQAANSYLAGLNAQNKHYEFMAVANMSGKVVASSVAEYVGSMDLSERGYFKKSTKGELAVSGVIISKGSGNPAFVISTPIEADGKRVGVFLAVVDMEFCAKTFIDPVKVGETGYVYVINDDGFIIAYPDRSKILKLDLKNYEFGKAMLAKKNGIINYHFKGIDKMVGFSQVESLGWIVASTAPDAEVYAPVRAIGMLNVLVLLVSLAVTVMLVLGVTQSIVRPVNKITQGIDSGSLQVASASGQIASTSQSLAEGASEQAAAVEQTSASMEELASMTRHNADNSGQVDGLMRDSLGIIERGAGSMQELSSAMQDITQASEETSKIIKTIDEIAFQTNLLALNAAVEAARAGEAGAGFAVVAEEVRNLAMRSADAAKSTATLIEGTVNKVHHGASLVAATEGAFRDISESVGKVGTLTTEINNSSSEQVQGITQVNTAVSEVDVVTQQSAASAEESAAAAEELNAQAEQLKAFTNDLVLLVNGKNAVQQAGGEEEGRVLLPEADA